MFPSLHHDIAVPLCRLKPMPEVVEDFLLAGKVAVEGDDPQASNVEA